MNNIPLLRFCDLEPGKKFVRLPVGQESWCLCIFQKLAAGQLVTVESQHPASGIYAINAFLSSDAGLYFIEDDEMVIPVS